MIHIHARKKLSAAIISFGLAAALLTGCGSGSSSTASGTQATAAAATEETARKAQEYAPVREERATEYITDGDFSEVKAGICVPKDADTELTGQISSFLTQKGIPEENISVKSDADSSSEVTQEAKQMLQDDTDVLFVDAGSRDAVSDIADAAAQRGKAVIFIGTAPSDDEINRWSETDVFRAFYAGPDTSQTPERQGDILVSLSEDDLDGNKNDKIGALLIDTDEDVLSKKMNDAGRSLDVLGNEDAGERADTASQKVKEALDDHKDDLEVIVCGTDEEALAAIKAVEDGEKTPGKDIFVIGAGASDEALQAINSGTLAGTVYSDTYEQAKKASEAAFDFLSGTGRSGTFLSDEIAVTESNVQEIIDYKG